MPIDRAMSSSNRFQTPPPTARSQTTPPSRAVSDEVSRHFREIVGEDCSPRRVFRDTASFHQERHQQPSRPQVDTADLDSLMWTDLDQRLLEAGYTESITYFPTNPNHSVFSDVPGSSFLKCEDVFVVPDGPMSGHHGTVLQTGGEFNDQEGSITTQFESSCSVRLDSDPARFHACYFRQDQLERYDCEARRRLQSGVEKCLLVLESNLITTDCRELLIPLLCRGTDIVKTGSKDRCAHMDALLASCLDQIADQIFKARST